MSSSFISFYTCCSKARANKIYGQVKIDSIEILLTSHQIFGITIYPMKI